MDPIRHAVSVARKDVNRARRRLDAAKAKAMPEWAITSRTKRLALATDVLRIVEAKAGGRYGAAA